MTTKQGSLSIDSENIFPIIKKWLYSDHDIFYREMVSNGCDAITKLKKLDVMGEYDLPDDYEPKVEIRLNPTNKTIQVIDNGIGMTADEVDEYINQIAFSGASDFLEKYKDKSSDDQIIGHFGLGFYSAFMVADEVQIDTLSYQEDAAPVHWSCDGATEFEMSDGDRTEVGTTVTLFLNEDCLEFCNEYRAREVLDKYCSFMPTEIYLINEEAAPQYDTIDPEDKLETDVVVETIIEEPKMEERENEDGEKEMVEVSPRKEKLKILKRPVPINDTHPLWTKNPGDCTDDEYKTFYRQVFKDYREPLFWIHLNMDYPFNLKGILYFPKINTEYDSIEGVIKLYNNQVFIADNIKEVIPEFLMLLKGVIDCPDLPLNVSRSALQNDGFVKKISDYITKKVADKLIGMCKTEKENYEQYWDDISPFIKYGCLKDASFCDRMNDYILFKDIYGNYLTLPELLKAEEDKKEAEKEAEEDAGTDEGADVEASEEADVFDEDDYEYEDKRHPIYYVTDENQQGQYVRMFKEYDMDAVILNHNIDTSFITQLEQRNQNYRFLRVDADVTEALKEDVSEEDLKEALDSLSATFRDALGKENLDVKVEKLKDSSVASVITLNEGGRRMQDMIKMYDMRNVDPSMFDGNETLTLNVSNPLVEYILENGDDEHVPMFCRQLYDLARLSNQPLDSESMTEFVRRSNEIMMILAGEE